MYEMLVGYPPFFYEPVLTCCKVSNMYFLRNKYHLLLYYLEVLQMHYDDLSNTWPCFPFEFEVLKYFVEMV